MFKFSFSLYECIYISNNNAPKYISGNVCVCVCVCAYIYIYIRGVCDGIIVGRDGHAKLSSNSG